jgi:bifunctional non-homologous end joining protein LigD
VRLYTINGADWSKRYPLISESAGRIQGFAILDAVWLDSDGVPQFDALHSVNDAAATALAFDILMYNCDAVRRTVCGTQDNTP